MRKVSIALLFLLGPATTALAAGSAGASGESLPGKAFLDALPAEIDHLHEDTPEGVPKTYDWQLRGKRDRWNDPPPNFTAITGWGQVFWTRGTGSDHLTLQLRNHETWLCQGNVWRKVQASLPTGAQYRADFAGNAARPPKLMTAQDSVLNVRFDPSTAFHFWPSEGRVNMTPLQVCGVRVLVQARVLPTEDGATAKLLLGLGADYWLTKTSAWDNYKTNYAVGVGKLRIVTREWKWYGFGTAR